MRAAARFLSDHLAIPASRSTLLRQVNALDDPAPAKVRVIGVDEFALRKGHVYGTVLVDVETRRPVDLLPDREATTVAAWLQEHPDIEVLCRDRAAFYAEAADTGAPQAVQVADRWHLWHNLGQAVERCVSDHRTELRPASSTAQDEDPEAEPAVEPAPAPFRAVGHRRANRVRETHAAVHDLRTKGHSMRSIQRRLRMGASTVVRYAHAATPEELLRRPRQERSSRVDPFKPYLDQRWDQEGCTNAWKLFEEIKELGYPGGYSMVRAYLYPKRIRARPAEPRPPRVRKVAGWIMTPPDALSEEDRLHLKELSESCPELGMLAVLVRSFGQMLTRREGHRLEEWLDEVRGSGLRALRVFVEGLIRDQDAVRAGLSLPWSSGAVEGNVNRIKMLKRQMYGRAGFALLRKRVLLA